MEPVEKKLEDHESRIRELEALRNPLSSAYVKRFENTEAATAALEKVAAQQSVIITGMASDITEIKSDAKAARTTIRSALITAAASIGVQVILFFALKGGG